jgi:hypothetical protein
MLSRSRPCELTHRNDSTSPLSCFFSVHDAISPLELGMKCSAPDCPASSSGDEEMRD